MTDQRSDLSLLYYSQRLLWYVFMLAFGTATVLYSLEWRAGYYLALGGAIALLAHTGFQLVLIAAVFAKEKKRRSLIVALTLLSVLAGIVLVGVLRT